MRTGMTVVAMALALAGCGKTAEESNSAAAAEGGSEVAAKTADPCSYLTAEEAGAITTDTVVETIPGDNSCRYKTNPDDGMVVDVYLTGGTVQMNAQKNAAGMLEGMGAAVADKGGAGADAAELLKKDGTAAPKLGDEVMWGMNSLLAVRKGDMFVSVTPPIMHDPASHSGYPLVKTEEKRAIAEKAMEKILARLNG